MKQLKFGTALAAGALFMAGVAQADIRDMVAEANAELAELGYEFEISSMHLYIADGADLEEREVFFETRGNKQLATQFVPDDARRAWSGADPNTLEWTRDATEPSADLAPSEESAAHAAAMETWEGVKCSEPGLTGGDIEFDTGFVSALFGFSGTTAVITGDIMFNGFLSPDFFEAISPGGGSSILGVHFGLSFTGGDSNNDGFADKAIGDIYFNDGFDWSTDGSTPFDIETVILHEAGHGLSQEHFGALFQTKKGRFQFAPRAVMNAGYTGPQRDLAGTDNGGHCSLWASWPNN